MRLAGLEQCAVCCEVMDSDGTMMKKEEAFRLAKKLGFKYITIKALQDYCRVHSECLTGDVFLRKDVTVVCSSRKQWLPFSGKSAE